MSIRLITGIPGSGKTYRVVYDLVKRGVLDQYYVIHNIANLRVKSECLRSYHPENNELGIEENKVFDLDYMTDLSKTVREKYSRNILLIVDECDKLGLSKVVESQKKMLSMHRHLGMDIWLVTQSRYNIARDYGNLVEIEINGRRGYVVDAFVYKWLASGEAFATDRLPKDKEVYDLYRSFHIAELKKQKSRLPQIAVLLVALVGVLFVYAFFFAVPSMFKKEVKTDDKQKTATSVGKGVGPSSSSYTLPLQDRLSASQKVKMEVVPRRVEINEPVADERVKTYQDRYALVGQIGNGYIVEDRVTGRQFTLSELSPSMMAVKYQSGHSLQVIGEGDKMIEFDVFGRFNEGKRTAPARAPVETAQAEGQKS